MYEAKQCKEKVSRTIRGCSMARQMVKMKKDETILNTIQRYFGKPDSSVMCNASVRVIVRDKNKFFYKVFLGEGGSDADSRGDVIDIFTSFGLRKLADIRQAANGNPPGQCAEPHAIADALKDLRRETKKYSYYRIDKITVDQARVMNPNNSMNNRGIKRGDVMPRCTTCAQWVPGIRISDSYLY